MFEHTVLMNPGLMGKGVGADDGLVGLDHETGNGGDQMRSPRNHLGVNAGSQGQNIAACA